MTEWLFLIVCVYALGFMVSLKPLIEAAMDSKIESQEELVRYAKRTYPHTWRDHAPCGDGPQKLTAYGRRQATWTGLIRALFWLLTLPVLLLSRSITPPIERRRAAERENAKLRELAEKAGLDWPEDVNS